MPPLIDAATPRRFSPLFFSLHHDARDGTARRPHVEARLPRPRFRPAHATAASVTRHAFTPSDFHRRSSPAARHAERNDACRCFRFATFIDAAFFFFTLRYYRHAENIVISRYDRRTAFALPRRPSPLLPLLSVLPILLCYRYHFCKT
jgi:hypothetical protein